MCKCEDAVMWKWGFGNEATLFQYAKGDLLTTNN